MVILCEKFRFIRDDIFLCPWVDSETGKQKLVMQKINLETNEVELEDSIDCIHAAVTDISIDKFNEIKTDDDAHNELLEETLFIRSSHNLREINLTPVEKYKALKSWVAGIAEAGKEGLLIQSRIDSVINIWVQISSRLLSFMAKIDPDYIYEILRKIEKECKFEGIYHKSSIIANLLPILWSISKPEGMEFEYIELKPEERKIMSAILKIEPPNELFEKNPKFLYLLKDFPDYFNNLNLIDSMDLYLYQDLSEINPSLSKKLLDEALKKCTKNGILDQENYNKYLNQIADWIFFKYDEFDYLSDFYGGIMYEPEKEIVFEFLNKNFSSSLIKQYPQFFKILFLEISANFNDKNKNLMASMLISDSIDFFEIIPKKILRRRIPFELDIIQTYFENIGEKYNSNKEQHEEWFIKKCTNILNLLILNPEELGSDIKDYTYTFNEILGPNIRDYTYNRAEGIYYINSCDEILRLLFKIHPPDTLFTRHQFFQFYFKKKFLLQK